MTESTQHAVQIADANLEIAVYTTGQDLVIAINAPGRPCLGRIILANLLAYKNELHRVTIGDHRLGPTLPPRT